ncbi:hypothetical protein LJK87_16295 [Paenibacillus sp. P25]|nr:hypothetical protein LJK87_16295 [Paenibacillus sp. P25]
MADVVVGTHALIQEDVYFRRLGLVVTDEQHRFGVNQRSILRRKGMNPDVLTMTATPIPRTLAITAFGDMDVSTLRESAEGAQADPNLCGNPCHAGPGARFHPARGDRGPAGLCHLSAD